MAKDIFSSKDEYMKRKYCYSSDEDTTDKKEIFLEDFNILRHSGKGKAWSSPITKKLVAKTNVIKPNLDAKPRSPKEDFLCGDKVLIPGSFNQYLFPYQRDGILFLWNHFVENRGCILADDMGLGKTIQVIGLFVCIAHRNKMKAPILVIAPTSILYNWSDELEVWADFRVGMFHRNSKEEMIRCAKCNEVDIVLTTPETMRIYLEMLSDVAWSVVVFDEVHKVKERTSQLTVAAKNLPSVCRIGLTGTPLQNNLKELWCLLDWANPNCLGSCKDFVERFAKPISVGQRFDASKRELATARKKQKEFVLLHTQWMLRRTKDKVQNELPNKEEKIVFCPVSTLQGALYEEILKLPKCRMLVGLDRNCRCRSGLTARKCCLKKYNWRKYLFPFIQLFLKLSNHAALILPRTAKNRQQHSDLSSEVSKAMFEKYPEFERLCKDRTLSNISNVSLCGKMAVLQKLLNVLLERRDKILIFSHSTQLLNIIEAYIVSRGFIFRRIDGKTPPKCRQMIVKEFNAEHSISICLLSTLVGSLGLNFTGANVVIIFDPLWNPTFEQQAQDRAYRIGQRRDVHVYRFISVGTMEENMYLRQIYKQQLSNTAVEMSNERRYFSGVAGNSKYRGELFGISNMFKFSKNHNSSFADEVFGKTRHRDNSGLDTAKYEELVGKSKKKKNEIEQQAADDGGEDDEGGEDDDEEEYSRIASQQADEMICESQDENKPDQQYVNETLAECDVSFAPSFKSLVGSSKREEMLSRHAITDVFWNGLNSQDAANNDDIISESDESQDVGSHSDGNKQKQEVNLQRSSSLLATKRCEKGMFERIGSTMFMVGGTPPRIIAEQFQQICLKVGYSTVEEFAKYLIENPEKLSREILRRYYLETEPSVRNISSFDRIYGSKHEQLSKTILGYQQSQNTADLSTFEAIKRPSTAKKRRQRKKIKSTAYVFESSDEKHSSDEMIWDFDSDNEIKNSTSIHKDSLKKEQSIKPSNICTLSNLTQTNQQNDHIYRNIGIRKSNFKTPRNIEKSESKCNYKKVKRKVIPSNMDTFTNIKFPFDDSKPSCSFAKSTIKHEIADQKKTCNSTDQNITDSSVFSNSPTNEILVKDSPFVDETTSEITSSETPMSCKRNTKADSCDVTVIEDSFSILDELMSTKLPRKTSIQKTYIWDDSKIEDKISSDRERFAPDAIERNDTSVHVSKFDPRCSILDELLNFTPRRGSSKETSTGDQFRTNMKTKAKCKNKIPNTSILDELMG